MPPMRRSRSVSHLDLNTHRRDPEARRRIQRRAISLDVSVGGSGASGGGRGGTGSGGGRGGTGGGGGGGVATLANRNPYLVNLVMQIVGILFIPVVVGVISGLSQMVIGVEKVDPKEKCMLYICAGISLTTVVLATVLVILSFVRRINYRRRDCIMWSMFAVAVILTIDMCFFIVSLLILIAVQLTSIKRRK